VRLVAEAGGDETGREHRKERLRSALSRPRPLVLFALAVGAEHVEERSDENADSKRARISETAFADPGHDGLVTLTGRLRADR
jgi:hypothetical protein